MGGEHEAITAGEFQRHTELLLRTMEQGFSHINERLDKVNGRLDRHDEAIAGVAQNGCGQLKAHRETLESIGGVAGLSTKKQAGIAAGAGAGLIGVIEIAKVVVSHFWK